MNGKAMKILNEELKRRYEEKRVDINKKILISVLETRIFGMGDTGLKRKTARSFR